MCHRLHIADTVNLIEGDPDLTWSWSLLSREHFEIDLWKNVPDHGDPDGSGSPFEDCRCLGHVVVPVHSEPTGIVRHDEGNTHERAQGGGGGGGYDQEDYNEKPRLKVSDQTCHLPPLQAAKDSQRGRASQSSDPSE